MDNSIEYLYQGSELNAYIHTRGGALFELDFLPASWNYLDTMVERDEQPDGEPGSASGPPVPAQGVPRPFLRRGLRHRGFPGRALRRGRGFPREPYDLVELNRALPELLMRRTGTVTVGGTPAIGRDREEVRLPARARSTCTTG